MLRTMKWLLSSAVLLALALVVAGAAAGRTLRERDAAVREGVVVRASHSIERELRERGPEDVAEILRSFAATSGSVSAVELRARDHLIARAGVPHGESLETPVFLGPAWRGMSGGSPGMMMGGGQSPFQLRIWPARGIGDSSRVAAIATWGSVVAAVALLAFAAAAARGIQARQRAVSLDAERQRLEVVAGAGAGLAHRIRNPLATIKATAQILEPQLDEASRARAARIVDASVRIESLVDELLMFARPVEIRPEDVDLGDIARSIDPAAEAVERVVVKADREHVTAAIEELVANAHHAGEGHPRIVVKRQGRSAVIEVRDRGAGLQLDASRAFDPYVTTRPDGTGLGLPTIRALIRANGGDVTLASREGGGCVATVELPAVSG
jgi:signal transduction histidine kinase